MATLSREQIAAYAKQAGFADGNETNVMTAIALAESGGNTNAYNHSDVTRDDSYGLWQINMYKDMGPTRRAQFGIPNNQALYNPATNAKAAYTIYKGSGFNAWTTYTTGKYKQFAGDVKPGTIDKNSGAAETVSFTDPITGLSQALTTTGNKLSETLFTSVSNVAGVIVAIVLLILGVVVLARGQVANLLPATKAAKIAKGVLK